MASNTNQKRQHRPQVKSLNQPYIETSHKEYEGIYVKYTKVYYKDYRRYFEGFDTVRQFYKKSNATEIVYPIVEPVGGNYVKNAVKKIDSLTDLNLDITRNIIIAMTISIVVSEDIVAAAKTKDINAKQFFDQLYRMNMEKFPELEVIHAYVNLAKNLLVVTGIPYVLKNTGKKRRYISYTKQVVRILPRHKLATELLQDLSQQPYFETYKARLAKIGTPEWREERRKKALDKDDLSYAALGLYIKLLYMDNPDEYNNAHLSPRNVEYTKNRSELVQKGYVVTVRPSRGQASIQKPHEGWKFLIL